MARKAEGRKPEVITAVQAHERDKLCVPFVSLGLAPHMSVLSGLVR